MKSACAWCAVLLVAQASAQLASDDGFYAPQTFKDHIASYQQGLFRPAAAPSWSGDAEPAPQNRLTQAQEPWRTNDQQEPWRANDQQDPWKPRSKEQMASILHHKQALSKEGNFRFEYAADNGVAAGEVIEPDGTRVGAYQYKDPSGQLVKLKYRAGKEGFQILEGSHLPKSPEPIAYPQQGAAYEQALNQQRQQFQLQQNYNQQPQQNYDQQPQQPLWSRGPQLFQNAAPRQPPQQQQPGAGNQYFNQNNWGANRPEQEDDGQYRENDLENQEIDNRGPHNFGEGYAFEFKGRTGPFQ